MFLLGFLELEALRLVTVGICQHLDGLVEDLVTFLSHYKEALEAFTQYLNPQY